MDAKQLDAMRVTAVEAHKMASQDGDKLCALVAADVLTLLAVHRQ